MSRQITHEEVKKHSNESSVWTIIHHEVYDVTKFLDEHPGGADALLNYAGMDSTQPFEDVGHSDDAREMMKKYKIGVIPPNERTSPPCDFVPVLNREVIVLPACNCAKDKKARSAPGRSSSKTKDKSPSLSAKSSSSSADRVERRVQCIIVPRGRPSRLKWAVIALAGALVIGFALKKYMAT